MNVLRLLGAMRIEALDSILDDPLMPPPPLKVLRRKIRQQRRGAALILVLGMLVLLSGLV